MIEIGTLLQSKRTGAVIRTTSEVRTWGTGTGRYVFGAYVTLHGRDAIDAAPVDVLNAQVRETDSRGTRFDFDDFEPVTA